jgi:ComF family protein
MYNLQFSIFNLPIHLMAILSGSAFRGLTNSILDFFYPPVCLSCRKLLIDGQRHVCEQCWDSIEPIRRDLELYQETRHKLCVSGTVDELVASFVFEKEGAFQHIAHALKYTGFQSIGIELGKRVGGIMNSWNVRADCLIPIPLHKRKLRERGFNQAELIARGASEVAGIPLRTDLVRRKKFTQSQTTLSLEERNKNVDDAFEIVPYRSAEVENKSFIVIDDVITTGSTILACANALRTAGAARIVAASAALAA